MSLGVTKKCFPPTTHCHNCVRKIRDIVTEKKDGEDLERCSRCHLMTYCDQDCQKEHWDAVHKHHCRFLSGKKVVANSEHSSVSCAWCITQLDANSWEILDVNSPKTVCHIEKLLEYMKMVLSENFEFHEDGKTCGCSLEFACNLPFSLGEVSGQYIGKGIDEMIAHAIRLVYAMCLKKRSETVDQSLHDLVGFRVVFWRRVLSLGEYGAERPRMDALEEVLRQMEDFGKCFGSNNAWFKALQFTIDIVAHLHRLQFYSTIDLRDLEDPRFQNMKKGYQDDEPQIKNVLQVSQNRQWTNFKLWPTLSGELLVLQQTCNFAAFGAALAVLDHFAAFAAFGLKADILSNPKCAAEGSAAPPKALQRRRRLCSAAGAAMQLEEKRQTGKSVQLPGGIRCDSCAIELKGEVAVTASQATTLPLLKPAVGSTGGLVAICSYARNPICSVIYRAKNPNLGIVHCDLFNEEWNSFLVKSRKCDVCLLNSLSSHRCSQCLAAQYCSTQCQMKDLDFHRTVCADWAKDNNKKMISSSQQKKAFKKDFESFVDKRCGYKCSKSDVMKD